MTPRRFRSSFSFATFVKARFLADSELKNFSQLYQRGAFGSGFSPHLGSIVKALFSHCSSVLLFLFLPFKFLSTIVALIVCLLFIDWPRRKATDRETGPCRAAYILVTAQAGVEADPAWAQPQRKAAAAARPAPRLSRAATEWHEE